MMVVATTAVAVRMSRRGQGAACLFEGVFKNMLRVLQRLGSGLQHFPDIRRFNGQIFRPLEEFCAVAVIVLNPMRQQHPHLV